MSDGLDMVVYGGDELVAQLEELSKGAGKVLLRAAEWGAQILADEMEKGAPTRTGRLAGHIGTKTAEHSADTAIVDVGPEQTAFYGRFQELGTVHHAAQPFMRPALDENDEAIVDAVAGVVEQIIGDVLG